jgi:hypothetical protein
VNEKSKFKAGFIATCVAAGLSVSATALVMVFAHMPGLRWALPAEACLAFGFLVWWIRRFRGRLPKPSGDESARAARSARNIGLFFIASPLLAYLANGREYFALPDKLGFFLPIVPLSLAVYFLRLSARLRRISAAPSRTVDE